MKGSMKEAVAALTAAHVSKTPVFVKKTEFSQEVVRYTPTILFLYYCYSFTMTITFKKQMEYIQSTILIM